MSRQYVRYLKQRYKRTVTLWEGQFKSCLVVDEEYLLHLYRYIELNSVRAGVAADPSEYKWSNYQDNALEKNLLCAHYTRCNASAVNIDERHVCSRSLFATHIERTLLYNIRDATQSGIAIGNDHFK